MLISMGTNFQVELFSILNPIASTFSTRSDEWVEIVHVLNNFNDTKIKKTPSLQDDYLNVIQSASELNNHIFDILHILQSNIQTLLLSIPEKRADVLNFVKERLFRVQKEIKQLIETYNHLVDLLALFIQKLDLSQNNPQSESLLLNSILICSTSVPVVVYIFSILFLVVRFSLESQSEQKMETFMEDFVETLKTQVISSLHSKRSKEIQHVQDELSKVRFKDYLNLDTILPKMNHVLNSAIKQHLTC